MTLHPSRDQSLQDPRGGPRLRQTRGMELVDADIWEAAGQPLVLCGGYTCSLALWSPGTGEEHHLRVGSPLWFVKSLLGDRAVVAGSHGIMAIQLTANLPGTHPGRPGKASLDAVSQWIRP